MMFLRKVHFLAFFLCTVCSFVDVGNCFQFSNEVNIMSRAGQGHKEVFEDDPTLLAVPDFGGEARIFGNFSFGNNSILTVAGFVIVGIILFGKVTNYHCICKYTIVYRIKLVLM